MGVAGKPLPHAAVSQLEAEAYSFLAIDAHLEASATVAGGWGLPKSSTTAAGMFEVFGDVVFDRHTRTASRGS